MCPFEQQPPRKSLIKEPQDLSYFRVPDIGKYEPKKLRSETVYVGDILKQYENT